MQTAVYYYFITTNFMNLTKQNKTTRLVVQNVIQEYLFYFSFNCLIFLKPRQDLI